jgi:hypothetical protein
MRFLQSNGSMSIIVANALREELSAWGGLWSGFDRAMWGEEEPAPLQLDGSELEPPDQPPPSSVFGTELFGAPTRIALNVLATACAFGLCPKKRHC